ncbi:MAG TPA: ABC transporter permease, partial [Acidimicrobiia bacterium]|nr:ABC transporter permease [Acidimicrobiia bacterium]
GLARQAELDPGVAVNAPILAAGFATLVVVIVAGATVAAVRVSTLDASTPRRTRGRAGATLDRLGLSPPARLGIGAVLSRRETGTAPRRIAVVAIAFAVAGSAAAATFGASLDHLVHSPREQGWNFDVMVGNPNSQSDQEARAVPLLAHDRYVNGFTGIAQPPETPTIDGHSVGLVGVDEREGSLGPPMLEGRFPTGPDEIAFGRGSLDALRKRVGDRVEVVAGPRRVSMHVTGVFIALSAGDLFSSRLDEGGGVTLDGLRRLEPDVMVTMFPVRYAPGTDRRVALARLQHDFGALVLQHVNAQDVENLVRVAVLPALLAGLFVVLSVATLAATLIASVRRRRQELTILKAIGFKRRQLAASIVWQTLALTLVGVTVGIPAGIVVGQTIWRYVADQIGAVQPPVVPVAPVAGIIVGAALIATAIALVPAALAAQVRPAIALRRE